MAKARSEVLSGPTDRGAVHVDAGTSLTCARVAVASAACSLVHEALPFEPALPPAPRDLLATLIPRPETCVLQSWRPNRLPPDAASPAGWTTRRPLLAESPCREPMQRAHAESPCTCAARSPAAHSAGLGMKKKEKLEKLYSDSAKAAARAVCMHHACNKQRAHVPACHQILCPIPCHSMPPQAIRFLTAIGVRNIALHVVETEAVFVQVAGQAEGANGEARLYGACSCDARLAVPGAHLFAPRACRGWANNIFRLQQTSCHAGHAGRADHAGHAGYAGYAGT
eukprot:222429-Chlamydomonas_euryale.AAC.2